MNDPKNVYRGKLLDGVIFPGRMKLKCSTHDAMRLIMDATNFPGNLSEIMHWLGDAFYCVTSGKPVSIDGLAYSRDLPDTTSLFDRLVMLIKCPVTNNIYPVVNGDWILFEPDIGYSVWPAELLSTRYEIDENGHPVFARIENTDTSEDSSGSFGFLETVKKGAEIIASTMAMSEVSPDKCVDMSCMCATCAERPANCSGKCIDGFVKCTEGERATDYCETYTVRATMEEAEHAFREAGADACMAAKCDCFACHKHFSTCPGRCNLSGSDTGGLCTDGSNAITNCKGKRS